MYGVPGIGSVAGRIKAAMRMQNMLIIGLMLIQRQAP